MKKGFDLRVFLFAWCHEEPSVSYEINKFISNKLCNKNYTIEIDTTKLCNKYSLNILQEKMQKFSIY